MRFFFKIEEGDKITKRPRPIFRGLFFEPDTCPPLAERDWEKRPFVDRHYFKVLIEAY
jgi:hypothetical protein